MKNRVSIAILLICFGGTPLAGCSSSNEASPVKKVTFEELRNERGEVSISGVAHYAATVKQETPASACRDEETHWLYGFFPSGNAEGRAIQLLVRSPEKPEDRVHFEEMTVIGNLERATPLYIPPQTEVMMSNQTDYYFVDDVMLLHAHTLQPLDSDKR